MVLLWQPLKYPSLNNAFGDFATLVNRSYNVISEAVMINDYNADKEFILRKITDFVTAGSENGKLLIISGVYEI